MTDIEMKKLEVRLSHWIEHNREHARTFMDAANQASQSGNPLAHDCLKKAAQQMQEAADSLAKALDALRA